MYQQTIKERSYNTNNTIRDISDFQAFSGHHYPQFKYRWFVKTTIGSTGHFGSFHGVGFSKLILWGKPDRYNVLRNRLSISLKHYTFDYYDTEDDYDEWEEDFE